MFDCKLLNLLTLSIICGGACAAPPVKITPASDPVLMDAVFVAARYEPFELKEHIRMERYFINKDESGSYSVLFDISNLLNHEIEAWYQIEVRDIEQAEMREVTHLEKFVIKSGETESIKRTITIPHFNMILLTLQK